MGDEELKGRCWQCGAGLTRLDYGREHHCPACAKPTHCCRNCRFYAPGRANECQEPNVERVLDKARANFCEWFEPTLNPQGGDKGEPLADPLAAAQALFGSR